MEDGLRSGEAARILAAVGHAVTVTDEGGWVTFWNPAAEQLFGWPAVDAVGRRLNELALERLSADDAEVRAALGRGEPWVGSFTARHREGRDMVVLASTTGLYDEGGRLLGAVAVSTGAGPDAASTAVPRAALEAAERKVAQLETALESRVLVEQAKGFLAAQHDVTPAEAFEALRRYARSHHLVMQDAARQVVRGEARVPVPYQGDGSEGPPGRHGFNDDAGTSGPATRWRSRPR